MSAYRDAFADDTARAVGFAVRSAADWTRFRPAPVIADESLTVLLRLGADVRRLRGHSAGRACSVRHGWSE